MGEETQVIPFIRNLPEAGAYVRAWKRGKRITAEGGRFAMDWAGSDLTADQFNRKMRGYLDARINLRGGQMSLGGPLLARKGTAEYQISLWRDCRAVRDILTRRLRVYQLETPEMRKRYGHLLASYSDD